MVATREQAEAALGARAREFSRHVLAALDEFVREFGPKRDKISKAAEAFIINDTIRRHLAAAYPADAASGPRSYRKGNSFLIIDREFNIKAKKLNAKLLASNVSTKSVRAFTTQQIMLPGFPEETNLHLGYQVTSEVELTSARVFLTCPSGAKTNRWAWQLLGASEVTKAQPAEVVALAKTRRVKLRESAKPAAEASEKSDTGGGSNGASDS